MRGDRRAADDLFPGAGQPDRNGAFQQGRRVPGFSGFQPAKARLRRQGSRRDSEYRRQYLQRTGRRRNGPDALRTIRKDRAETTIRKHQPQRYLDVDKHPARQSYSCVENLDALAGRVCRSRERQLRRGDRAEDFPCPDRRGQRRRETRNGGVQTHTHNIVVPRRQRAKHHAGKDQGELPPHQAGCTRHYRSRDETHREG